MPDLVIAAALYVTGFLCGAAIAAIAFRILERWASRP